MSTPHFKTTSERASRRDNMKQYIVDVKGIVILDDEWDNTQITIIRNGISDNIEFDKSDIVKTEEIED